eukprot:g27910.t1
MIPGPLEKLLAMSCARPVFTPQLAAVKLAVMSLSHYTATMQLQNAPCNFRMHHADHGNGQEVPAILAVRFKCPTLELEQFLALSCPVQCATSH